MTPADEALGQQSPRRYARWFKRTLLILFVAGFAYGGFLLYVHYQAAREYDRVVAELDRDEPGWQLADRVVNWPGIPPQHNAAVIVQEVHDLQPPRWSGLNLHKLLEEVPPTRRLANDDLAALEAALASTEPALQQARKLADLPRGRFDVEWCGLDWLPGAPGRHMQLPRTTAYLLQLDSLRLAQTGQIDESLLRAVCTLHVGRTLSSDPPVLYSLVRAACQSIAVHQVERALALGVARPETLERVAKSFAEEATQIDTLALIMNERALMHACLSEARENNAGFEELPEELYAKAGHVHMLKSLNDFVAAVRDHSATLTGLKARLPDWDADFQQYHQSRTWLDKLGGSNSRYIAGLHLGLHGASLTKALESQYESQARLRCTVAALAAERHLIANGQWPNSPDDLTPKYLREWPTDPSDGQPLRWKVREDGITVYSVARDGKDNGGLMLEIGQRLAEYDVGVRLWNPDKRRQAAKEAVLTKE